MREFFELINEYPGTTVLLFLAILSIAGILAEGFKNRK